MSQNANSGGSKANAIDLLSSDDEVNARPSRKKTEIVNLLSDDEDDVQSTSQNTTIFQKTTATPEVSQSPRMVCAIEGCFTQVKTKEGEALCTKCRLAKRNQESLRKKGSKVSVPNNIHETMTSPLRKAEISTKASVHSNPFELGRKRPIDDTISGQLRNAFDMEYSDLPGLTGIRPAKRVKLGIGNPSGILPIKSLATTGLVTSSSVSQATSMFKAPSVISETPQHNPRAQSIKSSVVASNPAPNRILPQDSSSAKGKSKQAMNNTPRSVFPPTNQNGTHDQTKSTKLEDNIKHFSSLIENERNSLVRSELSRNLPFDLVSRQQFMDKCSPFSQMKSIEVPGKGLETIIISLNQKASSVPFQETRCLVQKVPAFKNFEFITKNVVAADSKILRFRRFFYDPCKAPDRRVVEERERYDLVIESEAHLKAIRIAEDYATLYKHMPAILRSLNCTEKSVSESAKEAFAKVLKGSSKLELQTLIECLGTSYDIAHFIPKARIESSQDESDRTQGSNDDEQHQEDILSSYWQMCCPLCQVFQCSSHGETMDDTGDIKADLSFLQHSELLSSQHNRVAVKVIEPKKKCSTNCYRFDLVRNRPAPWNDEELALLKAVASGVEIPACLLKAPFGKECYDVHEHLMKCQEEKNTNLNTIDQSELPLSLTWYNNKKRALKRNNSSETLDSYTSVHKHAEMPKIKPCSHVGPCSDAIGGCHEKGLCNKLCRCSDECGLRFTGCNCAESEGACTTQKCPCLALGFECDPDLCISCGAVENAHPRHKHEKLENGCCNVALQRAVTPRVAIGESTFEGWGYGLFACEDISNGQFLGEYVGEIVTELEAERRGIVYEEYFFTLNKEQSVDATRKGNHMRFVNGTFPGDKFENCQAKVLSVLCEHRIAFFAIKAIKAGQEIMMDYGANYEEKHKLHGDGKAIRKENPKMWKLGNHEGQISIVVDSETPVPVVELPLQSSSPESSPPKTARRPGRRSLRHVIDSDDSDDEGNEASSQNQNLETGKGFPQPIDKESAAYKALPANEKHRLWSQYRWAKEASRGFGFGVGSKKEAESVSGKKPGASPSRSNIAGLDTSNGTLTGKSRIVSNSTDQSSSESNSGAEEDEEEEEEVLRPKRKTQMPLQYVRYYGSGN